MNAFSFIGLIWEIFRKDKPDLEKIQEKGLLSVKIGQMFALRIDFLKPETCAHLGKLYQQNTAMGSEDFGKLLDMSVDKGWRDNFETIDEEPLATASVAQVHRAKLKDHSKNPEVIVKLIKRDFTRDFERDVDKVLGLFKILIFFYPKLRKVANPVALLEMIKKDTLSELDLNNELKHQKVLREIYGKYKDAVDLSHLKFPEMHPGLSNEKVLVVEEIKGKTFQERLEEGSLDYNELLNLFHIHGFYIFAVGTFHGDIHPGNIILHEGNIYFIDCGAMATVSERLRKGLFNFMKHLSLYEFEECARWLHEMSEIKLSDKKYDKFQKNFLKLYKDFPGKTVSEVSLTEQMMYTIKMGINHGMEFGKGMFPIIKSLMYLDGMVIKCKPDAVLMEDMRENVKELERYMQ